MWSIRVQLLAPDSEETNVRNWGIVCLLFCLCAGQELRAEPVGTAFSFQGDLNHLGQAANGNFDFRFDIYNVAANGSPLAATVELGDVLVTDGAFTVSLDFGSGIFVNQRLWLQISVREGASTGNFTSLSPRQVVSPAPFSVQALTVPDGSITAAKIDTNSVQKRVTGSCQVGEVVRAINQDGSVVCESDNAGGCSLSACSEPGLPGFATLSCGGASVVVNCLVSGAFWVGRQAAGDGSWRSVTHGAGIFVAVANSGTSVMTSPNGAAWTARTPAEPNNWYAVTHGGGQFVAVAASGTNRVMTSPDGITWTPRSAPIATWNSVTYGNNLYVAVGASNVMTSPDGITWTSRVPAANNNWRSVTYGNGVFVGVSGDGTDRVKTSPDGITWTPRSAAAVSPWASVVYGNGKFVAVANSGTTRVMTSTNGISWTAQSAPTSGNWTSVAYGDDRFVAVTNAGDDVMTSVDGVQWFEHTVPVSNSWSSVAYGNGVFVAVADGGPTRVITSVAD